MELGADPHTSLMRSEASPGKKLCNLKRQLHWADHAAAYLDVDGAVRVKGVIYPVQGDVDVRHRVQQLYQKRWRWRFHIDEKLGSHEEN